MTGMIRYRSVMTHTYMFTRSPNMNSGSFCGAVGPMRGQGVGLGRSKKATVSEWAELNIKWWEEPNAKWL